MFAMQKFPKFSTFSCVINVYSTPSSYDCEEYKLLTNVILSQPSVAISFSSLNILNVLSWKTLHIRYAGHIDVPFSEEIYICTSLFLCYTQLWSLHLINVYIDID